MNEKKEQQLAAIGAGKDVPRAVRLSRIVQNFGIQKASRHVFLCTGPNCCTPEKGLETWEYLKKRVKELCPQLAEARIYRTKVNCFRICTDGPICVVYPDGVWYWGVTPEVCERILTEHVVGGRIVEEHCFARNRLLEHDASL